MIFLLNWVIFRFQIINFQGCNAVLLKGILQFIYFFLGGCDILLQQVNDGKMIGFRW